MPSGAVVIGDAVGTANIGTNAAVATSYDDAMGNHSATDGDTIRCSGERIGLLGIVSPELAGHCPKGRVCAPGNPHRASASLRAALVGQLRVTGFGTDRYGRTLAVVSGDNGDLSCWQLRQGRAIYKAACDKGHRIAATCPDAITR